MKDVLKYTLISILIILILSGACIYKIYDSHQNFPDYAKKDILHTKYQDYLSQIDSLMKSSSSQLDFAAKLEKLDHPTNLIYLCLIKETDFNNRDNDEIEINDPAPYQK